MLVEKQTNRSIKKSLGISHTSYQNLVHDTEASNLKKVGMHYVYKCRLEKKTNAKLDYTSHTIPK